MSHNSGALNSWSRNNLLVKAQRLSVLCIMLHKLNNINVDFCLIRMHLRAWLFYFTCFFFNLNKSLFSYCNCGLITDPFTLNSLIKSGYGPNVASNKTFIVKEDCLQLWDRYSKRSPGTSLSSFLKSLEDISIMNERIFFILHNY